MPGLYIQGEPDKSIEGPRRLDHFLTHVFSIWTLRLSKCIAGYGAQERELQVRAGVLDCLILARFE